jgi:hypothetical protein
MTATVERNRPLAHIESAQSAIEFRVNSAPTNLASCVMGLKKRRLTKGQVRQALHPLQGRFRARPAMQSSPQKISSSSYPAQRAKKESPRLFQARRVAGERVA